MKAYLAIEFATRQVNIVPKSWMQKGEKCIWPQAAIAAQVGTLAIEKPLLVKIEKNQGSNT